MIKKTMPHFIQDDGIYFGSGYVNPADRESYWAQFKSDKVVPDNKSIESKDINEKVSDNSSIESKNINETVPDNKHLESKDINLETTESQYVGEEAEKIIAEYLRISEELKVLTERQKYLKAQEELLLSQICKDPTLVRAIFDQMSINAQKVSKK